MSNGLFMITHSLQKAKSFEFPFVGAQDEGQPLDLIELHTSTVLGEYTCTAKTEMTDIKIGILPIRSQKALFGTEV